MTGLPRPVPASLLQYGILAFPLAFAGLPLYIHAPDFYVREAGLSLSAAGLILLLVRSVDALQDPLIGLLADCHDRRRAPIMYISMAVLALAFALLFNPPARGTAAWFAGGLLLASTAFSILSINLNALGSLWGRDTADRTRIAGWREGFGLAGLTIGALLPSLADPRWFAPVLAVLLLGAGLGLHRWLGGHAVAAAVSEARPGRRRRLNAGTRGFLLICLLSMLASAVPAVLFLFFVRDWLQGDSLAGLFLILYFFSGILAMPVWLRLARRFGTAACWLAAMLLGLLAFSAVLLLQPGDLPAFAAICLVSGAALGAELALPPALLSSLIDAHGLRGGTSYCFSLLALLSKAALALAGAAAFLLLDAAGFAPGAANTPDSLQALRLSYALLPCLIKAAAALSLIAWMRNNVDTGVHNARTFHSFSTGRHHGT